jgi:glutamine cyclotransferase
VLNGIAATGRSGEFLLTGKSWRFLHHVRLAEGRPRRDPARLLVPDG